MPADRLKRQREGNGNMTRTGIREQLEAVQRELDEAEAHVEKVRERRRALILQAHADERSDAQIGRWIGRTRQNIEALRRRGR